MSISNFNLDVTCEGQKSLFAALDIALWQESGAQYYRVHKVDGITTLRLYWSNSDDLGLIKLPYELKGEKAHRFVWDWLTSLKPDKDYGPSPDIDGSVEAGRAARVWGSRSSFYEVVSIRPEWAEYHK